MLKKQILVPIFIIIIVVVLILLYKGELQRFSVFFPGGGRVEVVAKEDSISSKEIIKKAEDNSTEANMDIIYNHTADKGLNDIYYELKNINIRSENKDNSIDAFVLEYIEKVSKIPDTYGKSQWKETEALIYKTISKKIENSIYYGPAGPRGGDRINKYYREFMETFNKERDKYINSKWATKQ